MTTPPLLMAATLLFWGWQTDLIIPAILAALALEGSRRVSFRLNLALRDYYRVWDLCGVLFLAALVIVYTSGKTVGAILTVAQWLPMIFLPIMAAQAYGAMDRLELGVFFLSMRRRKTAARETARPPAHVNVSYPYFALLIGSAAAANVRTMGFYAGLIVLSGWALWLTRSRRFSPAVWALWLALAAGAGFAVSAGLNTLQAALDEKFVEWYAKYFQSDANPFRTSTAIGEIGELKLSGGILFRVERSGGRADPILLFTSSYNVYRASSWYAYKSPFSSVAPEPNGLTWKLNGEKPVERSVFVSATFRKGKGMLTLPIGAVAVERLPAENMYRNRMGSVMVDGWPGFARYRVRMGKNVSIHGPPDQADLKTPEGLAPVLAGIVAKLELEKKSSRRILADIRKYFLDNFRYSLELESGKEGAAPLADFLIRTRAGHCEYFATATALLLRAAGVPARYAVGYAANEFSWLEKRLVVRSRDAHAWTVAYVDGAWQNFDTTPPVWMEEDGANASSFAPLSDLWSYAVFAFNEWRWSEEESGLKDYIVYLLVPLIALLLWRVFKKPTVARTEMEKTTGSYLAAQGGADSGIYLVEKRLNEMGFRRPAPETFARWIRRLGEDHPGEMFDGVLRDILWLHYRHRFDPAGLAEEEKETMERSVRRWLDAHTTT